MGAGVYWRVKVMRLIEDEVHAYGVTSDEAAMQAQMTPGVVTVMRVDLAIEQGSDSGQKYYDSETGEPISEPDYSDIVTAY